MVADYPAIGVQISGLVTRYLRPSADAEAILTLVRALTRSRRVTGLDVVAIFNTAGLHRYGEHVSQLEHALQCAELASRAGADVEVVLAALLHDLGHLIGMHGAETPERHHGDAGAAAVRPWVPERVARLIEHHVRAKRYLCARDPAYTAGLSPASVRSLAVQGGALEDTDCRWLEGQPWFADAVRIRQWDDLAKVPGARTAPLGAYRHLLARYFGPQSAC